MIMFVLAFVLSNPAAAASVVFCANYQVDYADALADLHDDYFTDNNDKKARGVRIRYIRNSDGAWGEEWATEGINGNCTKTLNLSPWESHQIRIYSEAYVDSINKIKVVSNATGSFWYSVVLAAYTPPLSGETKTITTSATHEAWNIAAAAGWASHIHNGGVTGETFLFRSGASGNSFQLDGSGNPYISIQSDRYKFIIVHEMGHWMTYAANGHTSGTIGGNSGASGDGLCPGGLSNVFNSKEYQKTSVMDGYASFYAAVAFNNADLGENCYYYRSGVDWDGDPGTAHSAMISCELGPYPYPGTGSIAVHDYLGYYCLATGESNNRSTMYDWIRFSWSMVANEGWGYADLLDVLNRADPHSWNTSGNGTGSGYPATELLDATSFSSALEDSWLDQAGPHGADR